MVTAAVAVVTWLPEATATKVTETVETKTDERMCAALDAIIASAFMGISPGQDASVEEFRAVMKANERMAEVRNAVGQLDAVKELGCG